jgi:hypothetical protein
MRKTFLIVALFAASLIAHAAGEDDYKKLSQACRSCNDIENLVVKHNTELSPDQRLDYALKIAKIIEKISVKSKNEIEQKRETYFAINGTVQVLDDDFDSETVVRLLDLRTQIPKSFDYVLWRFPLVHQQRIIERMKAFKEDKIRPKAQIPEAKVIEP